MNNCCKQSSVTISDFTRSCFNLNLNIITVFLFYDGINPMVIYERNIYIQPFHEHLANQIVFYSFAKTGRVSKRYTHPGISVPSINRNTIRPS